MIARYDWARGHEAMLRFGPQHGPIVVMVLPLFEEANRTRAFAVTILRHLATLGIGSVLPDLPGQGESENRLEDIGIEDWTGAFFSAVEAVGSGSAHIAAIRSGGLVTGGASAASRWLFAPQAGDTLVRDLMRIRSVAHSADPRAIIAPEPPDAPIEIAGNRIAPALLDALRAAPADTATPTRSVRLDTDQAAADRKVAGAPLWRQSEPGNDPALAALLATDIAQWIETCGT